MRLNKWNAYILLLVAGLVLSACMPASTEPVPVTGEDALGGTSWVLQTIDGAAPLIGSRITAEFQSGQAQAAVGGSAGCNSYSAGYRVSGTELVLDEIISTEMYCMDPAGVTEQEQIYLGVLREIRSFQVDGDRLELRDAAGQARLVFRSG